MLQLTTETFFEEHPQDSPGPVKHGAKHIFRLEYASYSRTRLPSWLLLAGFLLCAGLSVVVVKGLWSTYAHTFVPYLRWQDVLVVSLCYIALMALAGCVLVVRFFYALHAGHHKGMLILIADAERTELIVRDLSPKNLAGICSAVGTACTCFAVGVVGLVPEMLLGWTLHLPHPALVVLCTAVVLLLGMVGLVVTLLTAVAIGIGLIGCVSFCKRMGAPQSYLLTSQTSVRIDAGVLTVISPDKPESTVDLKSLEEEEQSRLLSLLERFWQPEADEEIGIAEGDTVLA